MQASGVMRRRTLLPVRPRGWWFDLLLVAGFVALTLVLANGYLLGLDRTVADWSDANRPAPLYWASRVLNYLGQGGQVLMPLAVLLAAAVAWRRRSVRPFLPVVAAFLLTYLTIGPLKLWLERAAPHSLLADRVEILNDLPPGEYGLSYPSGHVANAIAWYGVIALLVGALLRALDRPPLPPSAAVAIRVLPPAVVFCTTTYLAFHWITDSVAGLLLGVVLTRLLARIPYDDVPLPELPGGWGRSAGLTPPPSGAPATDGRWSGRGPVSRS
jgi:membrane-associated phospholipid phosphatase